MRVFSFSLLFSRAKIANSLINSLVALQLSVAQMVSFRPSARGARSSECDKGENKECRVGLAHAETTIFSSGLWGEPILQKWFSPHNKHPYKSKFETQKIIK